MNERTSLSSSTPAEVRPLHGILFVLACLALILCLLMVSVASFVKLTYVPGDPDEAGLGEIGVMLGDLGAAFIVLMLRSLFRPVWLVGTLLAGVLVLRRRNKPRWMWLAALCMTGGSVLMGAVMMLCL